MVLEDEHKVRRGDRVVVAACLPDEMAHFSGAGEVAIVMGTYADLYGGEEKDAYALLFEHRGHTSWWGRQQLTWVESGCDDLMREWTAARALRE